VPSLAVDGLGKLHLAYRRAAAPAGIYYLTNQSGRWSSPVRVTGTSAQDDAPCLAAASTSVHLAFSRSRVGIFTAVKPRAQAWSAPARRTSSTADSAPALIVDANGHDYLVLRRNAGAKGVYFATNRTGRWSVATRTTGTSAADVTPALTQTAEGVELAFARTASTAGIYTSVFGGSGQWSAPARRSSSAMDTRPALTVDGSGAALLVFDRG
jgi:hypothetical protein